MNSVLPVYASALPTGPLAPKEGDRGRKDGVAPQSVLLVCVLSLMIAVGGPLVGWFLGFSPAAILAAFIFSSVCQFGIGLALVWGFRLFASSPTLAMLAVLPVGWWGCCILWAVSSYAGVLQWTVPFVSCASSLCLLIVGWWRVRRRVAAPTGEEESMKVRVSGRMGFGPVTPGMGLLGVAIAITFLYAPERSLVKGDAGGPARIAYHDHLYQAGLLFELQRGAIVGPFGNSSITKPDEALLAGGREPFSLSRLPVRAVTAFRGSGYFFYHYGLAPHVRFLGLDVHSIYFGFGLWWARLMLLLALAAAAYAIRTSLTDSVCAACLAFVFFLPAPLSRLWQNLLVADWDGDVLWYVLHNPTAGVATILFLCGMAVLFQACREPGPYRRTLLLAFSGLIVVSLAKFKSTFLPVGMAVWGMSSCIGFLKDRRWCSLCVGAVVPCLLALAWGAQYVPQLVPASLLGAPSGLSVTATMTPGSTTTVPPVREIGFAYGVYPDWVLTWEGSHFNNPLPHLVRTALLVIPHAVRVPVTTFIHIIGQQMGLFLLPLAICLALRRRGAQTAFDGVQAMGTAFALLAVFFLWDIFITHPGHGRFSPWQVTAGPNVLLETCAAVACACAVGWFIDESSCRRRGRVWGCSVAGACRIAVRPTGRRIVIWAACAGLLLQGACLIVGARERWVCSVVTSRETLEALDYIRRHTDPMAVILTDRYWEREELVNGIAGRRTLLARHETAKEYEPVVANERLQAIRAFWSTMTSRDEQKQILAKYHVTHVLDFSHSASLADSDLLEVVYKWTDITLYQVVVKHGG